MTGLAIGIALSLLSACPCYTTRSKGAVTQVEQPCWLESAVELQAGARYRLSSSKYRIEGQLGNGKAARTQWMVAHADSTVTWCRCTGER